MEPLELARALAALLFVFGLLAGAAWLVRRLGLAARLGAARPGTARLALVESRWLDSRTRLLLLRCDDREHLLLVTGSAALHLEKRDRSSQASPS